MSLGRRLRELREQKGIGIRVAAERIGFSHSMLARIEAGDGWPSEERRRQLADLYGVPVIELATEEAIERGRIEVPAGVPAEEVRQAIYRLAGAARPEGHRADSPPAASA